MTEITTDNLNPHAPENDDSLAFLDRPPSSPVHSPELDRIDRELAERDGEAD